MREMTEKTANNQIAYVVSLYNQYVQNEDWFAAEELLDLYPALIDYDSRGNYVGAVAYENGWTQ